LDKSPDWEKTKKRKGGSHKHIKRVRQNEKKNLTRNYLTLSKLPKSKSSDEGRVVGKKSKETSWGGENVSRCWARGGPETVKEDLFWGGNHKSALGNPKKKNRGGMSPQREPRAKINKKK